MTRFVRIVLTIYIAECVAFAFGCYRDVPVVRTVVRYEIRRESRPCVAYLPPKHPTDIVCVAMDWDCEHTRMAQRSDYLTLLDEYVDTYVLRQCFYDKPQ
jgi:hypothetical protein